MRMGSSLSFCAEALPQLRQPCDSHGTVGEQIKGVQGLNGTQAGTWTGSFTPLNECISVPLHRAQYELGFLMYQFVR